MERHKATHYVFVTGGVLSGLGKGITAASLGAVLKARGIKVTIQKCDPYLNVDAGTLNPAEHGECFVTKDGAETDLDLGHYERFLDIELTQASSTMAGRLLRQLIADERGGKFLGKTVQLVPHFTDAIQQAIIEAGAGSDIHIVEIGGTVGDYEGLAFMEAIREMAARFPGRCAFAHVVYVPYLGTSKEFKTKPAQNAVRDLRGLGIVPDLLLVRTESAAKDNIVAKLSMYGGVPREAVIQLPNARTVYQVPLTLEEHHVGDLILRKFGMKARKANMKEWREVVAAATAEYPKTVHIGIVAKYLDNEDTYFSVMEALKSAAWANNVQLQTTWVDAEKLEEQGAEILDAFDGIVVPGGFGSRGIEGKIKAAAYAMEHNIPYLGLCLGLQMAVIAAARKSGLKDATTGEVDPNAKHQVVYIMSEQKGKEATGGTMRLGDYTCVLQKGSLAEKLYGAHEVVERHRHRYEVNQAYRSYLEDAGLVLSGVSPDGTLVEMIEHRGHPFFIATQAHPEFKSRPHRPHPLFDGLIKAATSK
ncbi:MAG: CTP synthase [Candidatus Saccharimonadales bacterium]